jgi:pimeloyl-ACP methyl ester carboxylesterase
MIHGMFMTPGCYDGWKRRFEERGYRVITPAWPLHGRPPADMRRAHPEAALGALTLDEVVAEYERVVRALDEPPILVGHSMGGLIVQVLLSRGLGAAGVAIDSAPAKGVISFKWSFLKSNWPVISPTAPKDEPYLPTLEEFRYAFANTLSDSELRAAYDAQVVPESRRVGNAPTTPIAAIDFDRARPPLLFIAGGADHIIPASLNWSNYSRYDRSPGLIEFREFPGRSHYTLAQAGWEEVADFVLQWITEQGRRP